MRISKTMLEKQVDNLNGLLDTPERFSVDYAYGGARLVARSGSKNIGPRGTKTEVYYQVTTAIEIIEESKRA